MNTKFWAKRFKDCLAAVGGIVVAISSQAAWASTVTDDFTISEPGSPTITFNLPMSPTPLEFAPGISFDTAPMLVTVNGNFETDAYTFLNSAVGGGLDELLAFYALRGTQVYKGPESNPTFIPGVYTMLNGENGGTAMLSISVTPLPTSWLLLIGPLVGLAFFAYRGSRKAIPSVVFA